MGIGASIFLIAIGAILRFAVNISISGFNLRTAGTILMIIGIIGAIFSTMFWSLDRSTDPTIERVGWRRYWR